MRTSRGLGLKETHLPNRVVNSRRCWATVMTAALSVTRMTGQTLPLNRTKSPARRRHCTGGLNPGFGVVSRKKSCGFARSRECDATNLLGLPGSSAWLLSLSILFDVVGFMVFFLLRGSSRSVALHPKGRGAGRRVGVVFRGHHERLLREAA